jgi:acyl carrier protein
MNNVASDVIEIISKKMRVPRPNIQLSDRLEDLEVDSISAVEMIFDLEEKFDIEIAYNANNKAGEFDTVGDVVRAIQSLVSKA